MRPGGSHQEKRAATAANGFLAFLRGGPRGPSRVPRVEVNNVLAIASTGHGASLSFVDRAGIVRSSQLERWSGVKYMLLFARDEDEAIRNPTNDLDRGIHYILTGAFGRFPDSMIFEDVIEPWVDWLLGGLGVTAADIDLVVTSDSHFATCSARLGPQLGLWFPNAATHFDIEHHEIHQRQAFWQSGMDEAVVLTLDNCGEDLARLGGRKLAGTIAVMNHDGECKVLREFLFPEMSSGLLYSVASAHVGFPQGEEGKTMGLAPYGTAALWDTLRDRLRLHHDGGFSFLSLQEFTDAMEAYVEPRRPGEELSERHADVAFAVQALIDEIVINAWRAAMELSGCRNIAYSGGVALNSVANDLALRALGPDRVYIAPNPGDAGHALGCALYGAYELAKWDPPQTEIPEYLGPPYPAEEVVAAAAGSGFPLQEPAQLPALVARIIANGHIVSRFDGGAEFGPRALGNRSILCDPRRAGMKDFLNHRVKQREGFRPFAPSVLSEYAADWFEMSGESAYMLRVIPVRIDKRSVVPAITHVDGTGRVQTVAPHENPGYREIISAFHELTGVPLVLNTSFNLAGHPIVETPQDAVRCFAATDIDVLVLGRHVVSKEPIARYLEADSGA